MFLSIAVKSEALKYTLKAIITRAIELVFE
jgi:hypothetical protein